MIKKELLIASNNNYYLYNMKVLPINDQIW